MFTSGHFWQGCCKSNFEKKIPSEVVVQFQEQMQVHCCNTRTETVFKSSFTGKRKHQLNLQCVSAGSVEHCIAVEGLEDKLNEHGENLLPTGTQHIPSQLKLVAHAVTMHTHSISACIERGDEDQQGHRRHCYCFLKQSHGCSRHKCMSQNTTKHVTAELGASPTRGCVCRLGQPLPQRLHMLDCAIAGCACRGAIPKGELPSHLRPLHHKMYQYHICELRQPLFCQRKTSQAVWSHLRPLYHNICQ